MNAFTKEEVAIPTQGESLPEFPFHALEDVVMIEQMMEEKSAGGIMLTGADMKLPCGRVVAAGPGRIYTTMLDASGHNELAYFVPMRVKVGDFVTFGRFQTGEPLQLNGKRYLACRQGDLAMVSKTGEAITMRLDVQQ